MTPFRTLAFAALLICGASAETSPPPVAPPLSSPVADISIHDYGDHDKGCAEWTDRCRTCLRSEAGEQVCSNIGPACQPAAITCARKVKPAQ
jgi:hypothetical protein